MHKHLLKLVITSTLLDNDVCECLLDKGPQQSLAGVTGRMQREAGILRSDILGKRQFSAMAANPLAEQNCRDTYTLRHSYSQLDPTLAIQAYILVS